MGRPKLRHLAIYTLDTDKLASFYVTVFDMEITLRAGPIGKGPVFLTDGHMNLAILPATTQGEAAVGLNHFGFHVEDVRDVTERLLAEGVEEPTMRPAGRYAEFRATDPCGNAFDLSEHGFQQNPTARDNRTAAGGDPSADNSSQ
jgi:predicted enzyme related to lactoylglutathione lyase